MAKNAPKYNNAFGLNPESFKTNVREVQEDSTRGTGSTSGSVHEVQERRVEFGATQGRKGHKAKRINMAFSDENHEWIKRRSRQLGISATEFVNSILDKERSHE